MRLEHHLESIEAAGQRRRANGLYHIHIPKTGGGSLYGAYNRNKNFHHGSHRFGVDTVVQTADIDQYEKGRAHWPSYIYDRRFRSAIRFAVIRHPMKWIASYYTHNRSNDFEHTGWSSSVDYHGFETFDEFADAYCDPAFAWHCKPLQFFQIAQCFDVNDRCRVDFLVYNEKLQEACEVLERLFDLRPARDRGRRNVSASAVSPYERGRITDRLLFRFRTEFSLFGYQPDGSLEPDRALIPNDGVFLYPQALRFNVADGRVDLR